MDGEYSIAYNARRKGKFRALPSDDIGFGDASERTPLLANDPLIHDDPPPQSRLRNIFHRSGENGNAEGETPSSEAALRRRKLPLLLAGVFLGTLVLTILGLVFLALLARASSVALKHILADPELQEALAKDALIVAGPLKLDFVNATASDSEGTVVWLSVGARMGIDGARVVNNVLDVLDEYDMDRHGKKKRPTPPWNATVRRWQEAMGRWGVRQLGQVSVTASDVALYAILSNSGSAGINNSRPLFNVRIPPLTIPLSSETNASVTLNSDDSLSWLASYSLPIRLSVTPTISDIEELIRESWESGLLNVRFNVPTVKVNGGELDERTWRGWLKVEEDNLGLNLKPPGTFAMLYTLVSLSDTSRSPDDSWLTQGWFRRTIAPTRFAGHS